ncbi:MAG: F0F1 ATP synthase subunit epsilon [Alphaproteobacteria bacterium]|nr:F0F1 ATP synthase subunit epsilon [Alphaproteobacteria bacterium]
MADKLALELVSPERLLVSAEADMVVVPGSEGDFGVLASHAPVISSVRPGVIEVHDEGKETERIFITGGFAEVTAQGLTVLAEEAIPAAEMDRGDLEQRLKDAEEDLEDAETDEAAHKAQAKIALVSEMLKAVN